MTMNRRLKKILLLLLAVALVFGAGLVQQAASGAAAKMSFDPTASNRVIEEWNF